MVMVGVIARCVIVMRPARRMLMLGRVVMVAMIVMAFLMGMLEPDECRFSGECTKHHGKHKHPCCEGGEHTGWF